MNNNGELADIEDETEPASPFTFMRPFDTVPTAQQREAGALLNEVHEAVFRRFPGNVDSAGVDGLISSTFRKKDVVVSAVEARTAEAVERFGTKYLFLAQRLEHGRTGHVVEYHVDKHGVARRWSEPPQTPNALFRAEYASERRQQQAARLGPKAVKAAMAAEQAEIMAQGDMQLHARMGTDYLPVGPDEIRDVARYAARRLRMDDEILPIIGDNK